MTRTDRFRRVVLLCGFFTRNLAYYRAAWRDDAGAKRLRGRQANFWRHVNSNFLEFAVLDWCKLFADSSGHHHWSKVVSDPNRFETELFQRLGLSAESFNGYVKNMRRYRDKFIAHLDEENSVDVPILDTARSAVSFLHEYLLSNEVGESEELNGLVTDLNGCYDGAFQEASRTYDANGL